MSCSLDTVGDDHAMPQCNVVYWLITVIMTNNSVCFVYVPIIACRLVHVERVLFDGDSVDTLSTCTAECQCVHTTRSTNAPCCVRTLPSCYQRYVEWQSSAADIKVARKCHKYSNAGRNVMDAQLTGRRFHCRPIGRYRVTTFVELFSFC